MFDAQSSDFSWAQLLERVNSKRRSQDYLVEIAVLESLIAATEQDSEPGFFGPAINGLCPPPESFVAGPRRERAVRFARDSNVG